MYRGFKVKLFLSKKQKRYLISLFKIARNIYNESLDLLNDYYKLNEKIMDVSKVRKHFINNILNNDYKKYPIESFKNIVNHAYLDFKNSISKDKVSCRYKSTFSAHQSFELNPNDFYVKNDRLFINSYIKINPEVNRGMKFKERGYFPNNKRIYCPHLLFDGIDFYLSASFNIKEENKNKETKKIYSLGIDVGVKNWFTFSDGKIFSNVNKSKRMYCLDRKASFIQKKKDVSKKLSEKFHKPLSNNYFKLHEKYLRIRRKQARIRTYYLYQVISEIVKVNPEFVCIEDIKVVELAHENNLAKYIFEATFRKFRTILDYKCRENGIKVLVANHYYPSSKICSNCGCALKTIELSQRTFTCPNCGLIIDRDLNAAINLSKLVYKLNLSSLSHDENEVSRA